MNRLELKRFISSRDYLSFNFRRSLSRIRTSMMSDKEEIISVDYEIFGSVQGVFFRKYTQAEGKKLGLVGRVQNTEAGTVQGQLQGPSTKVKLMQEWLKTTGSPKSQIIKAEFKNERRIECLDHKSFKIVHS